MIWHLAASLLWPLAFFVLGAPLAEPRWRGHDAARRAVVAVVLVALLIWGFLAGSWSLPAGPALALLAAIGGYGHPARPSDPDLVQAFAATLVGAAALLWFGGRWSLAFGA